jgi:hypothetical protein
MHAARGFQPTSTPEEMQMIATKLSAATDAEGAAIRSFKVGFAEAELSELRRRVNGTRWPERATVTDDSQGVPLRCE